MAAVTRALHRRPESSIHGTLFIPQRGAPSAGVLLIGGSSGKEPSFLGLKLAEEGVAALSVAYFGAPGLPPTLADIPLEYFQAGIAVLKNALPSPGIPVLTLGASRGSEAALLSGIHFGDLVDGVVTAVPGNVVLCGWPPRGPARLLAGRPLPFLSRFGPTSPEPEAIIPAEQVRGPILLVSAGADRVWPSAAMAAAIAERLVSRGHRFRHKVLNYPEAGHALGYLIPDLGPRGLPAGLADDPATRAARADAWPKVLEFIRACPRRIKSTN